MTNMLACYQKRTKNGVMGWMRELETELSNTLKVPMVIKQICLKYVKHIDRDEICICGAKFKHIPISGHEVPRPNSLLPSDNYSHYHMECDSCGKIYWFLEYRFNDCLIQDILYCDQKSKLHCVDHDSNLHPHIQKGKIIFCKKCKECRLSEIMNMT